jgi:hypothetical protein
MKKISIAAAREIEKVAGQRLTVGLDLGDRSSWYCVLNEAGMKFRTRRDVRVVCLAVRSCVRCRTERLAGETNDAIEYPRSQPLSGPGAFNCSAPSRSLLHPVPTNRPGNTVFTLLTLLSSSCTLVCAMNALIRSEEDKI